MDSTWRTPALLLVALSVLLLTAGATARGAAPSGTAHNGSFQWGNAARLHLPSDEFAGGSGTEEDPYLVASGENLDNVRDCLDAHFLQTAEIDLSVGPWSADEGWEPIGTSDNDNQFTGVFDGAGHPISGLTIDRPEQNEVGLFGYIGTDGLVQDLGLKHASVTGKRYVGSLVGHSDGTVTSSYATGEVTGSSVVGGLVGGLGAGSRLHYAFTDMAVQGGFSVGGLVGANDGEIRHSQALGTVHGMKWVGGLAGWSTIGLITDCYSRASVGGDDYVAGLVGLGGAFRSYSTGRVEGTGIGVGGFAGSDDYIFNECYWDIETSGQTESPGAEGCTTQEMQQKATYRYYNFRTLWTIDEGHDYPVFQDLSLYDPPEPLDLADLHGSGSGSDPYHISTPDELYAVRQDRGASYRLTNDIDLRASVVWDYGRGWEPIGTVGRGNEFTGTLDGAGHTIRYLTINRPDTSDQGLFGPTANAALRHIHLVDVNVHGGLYSGGLVGSSMSSDILDASVTGYVLSAHSAVGGLAGDLWYSEMSQVSAAGEVQGLYRVGGLVGVAQGRKTVISDAYSRAGVTGAAEVGGLLGYLGECSLSRSYSAGRVRAPGDDVGGLVGMSRGTVSDCYWDAQTSGQSTSAGGESRTSDQMTHPHAEDTYVGWDFEGTWVADVEYVHNDGYPYLRPMVSGSLTNTICLPLVLCNP